MVKLSSETVKVKFSQKIAAKFSEIANKLLISFVLFFEKLIPSYSLIGDTAFFDHHYFEWVKEIDANWMLIRKELDEVLKHQDHLPNFQEITDLDPKPDNLWKTYFMYGYGIKTEKNCQRCPETTRLIEKIPGMKTAFFSILMPGKHIPEHRGLYKGVIRCLLALKVPEPKEKCWIRVGNETRHWEEGKSMIFDDTFPHEARNETDGVRVVLFLDVMRPMRFPFSFLNELLVKIITFSPTIQSADIRNKKWEDRLEKLFGKENQK